MQVEHVAPMLAMDGGVHAGGSGDELRFQRGQIAGVHQIRFELAQQSPQPHGPAETMSRRTVQGMELDRLRRDALAKIAIVGERNHGMPVALRRQGIEQVDHAVLQAAGIETVEEMHDLCGHYSSTWSSPRTKTNTKTTTKQTRVAVAVLKSAFLY